MTPTLPACPFPAGGDANPSMEHLDGIILWRNADGSLGHDRPLTPEEYAHFEPFAQCLTPTAVLCLSTVAVPLGNAMDRLGLIPLTSHQLDTP